MDEDQMDDGKMEGLKIWTMLMGLRKWSGRRNFKE